MSDPLDIILLLGLENDLDLLQACASARGCWQGSCSSSRTHVQLTSPHQPLAGTLLGGYLFRSLRRFLQLPCFTSVLFHLHLGVFDSVPRLQSPSVSITPRLSIFSSHVFRGIMALEIGSPEMERMMRTGEYSDLQFFCRGAVFRVHKLVVCRQSNKIRDEVASVCISKGCRRLTTNKCCRILR